MFVFSVLWKRVLADPASEKYYNFTRYGIAVKKKSWGPVSSWSGSADLFREWLCVKEQQTILLPGSVTWRGSGSGRQKWTGSKTLVLPAPRAFIPENGIPLHLSTMQQSGDQTYKHFLSPSSKFDPFWFISYNRFSDLLFHLFLAIFISILTWAGRRNVGTFIN